MYTINAAGLVHRDADGAAIPEDPSNRDWQAYQAWRADGGVASTPAESPDQTKRRLTAAVQAHLDAAARAAGYDSIFTAVTYADEPAVARFQTEGLAMRQWRSLVWGHCIEVMAAVEAGQRVVPTDAELIAELPVLELP